MTALLPTVFDVTAIVGGALVAVRFLKRRSAALRHWILAGAFTAAVAAQLVAPFVPARHLGPATPAIFGRSGGSGTTTAAAEIVEMVPGRPPTATVDAQTLPSRSTLVRTVAAVWLAGVLLSVAMLGLGLGRLWWIAAGSTPISAGPLRDEADLARTHYGMRRPVRLVCSRHPLVPVTWGFLRPTIALPEDALRWPRRRVQVVLCHEMAHAARGDWLAQMLAELLRSLHWFNPILWLAASRLRRESEHACDDAVLETGVEASAYASQLLELARAAARLRRPPRPAQAIVRPSILERRISAMLNVQIDHSTPSPRARRVAAAWVAGAAVALVAFSGAAQPQTVLSGTVVDASGRAIPSPSVALTSVDTGARHEVRGDASGQFQFVALPSGTYALTAEALGFAPMRRQVTLTGPTGRETLSLDIAHVEEMIRVLEVPPPAPPGPRPDRLAQQSSLRAKMHERCAQAPDTACLEPPLKLKDVRPVFPPSLAGTSAERTVVLTGTIGLDGVVHGLQAVGDVPTDLAQAAIDAVSQWRFEPTRLDGQPIETGIRTTVRFVPGR